MVPVSFIREEHVTKPSRHCSFEYTAEASDLGWPPGHFPRLLNTNLGNKQNFHLIDLTCEKATYTQAFGCISLVVFND